MTLCVKEQWLCWNTRTQNKTKESAGIEDNENIDKSNENNDKKVEDTENSLVLTLPRIELDDEQLADVKIHARESGMNLDEFLIEMQKKVEGYFENRWK